MMCLLPIMVNYPFIKLQIVSLLPIVRVAINLHVVVNWYFDLTFGTVTVYYISLSGSVVHLIYIKNLSYKTIYLETVWHCHNILHEGIMTQCYPEAFLSFPLKFWSHHLKFQSVTIKVRLKCMSAAPLQSI